MSIDETRPDTAESLRQIGDAFSAGQATSLLRLNSSALHCCDCQRRFFCNRCPECAGRYRDERADGYKRDAAEWRERALRAEAAHDALRNTMNEVGERMAARLLEREK